MDYEKRKKFIVNLTYIGLIFFIAYIVVKYGMGLFTPFLMAFVIAYLLVKPAKFLARKVNLPYKPVALLLVLVFYSTIGMLAALLGIKMVLTVSGYLSGLPAVYTHQMEPFLSSLFYGIEQFLYKMDPTMVAALNDLFTQLIQSLGELITNMSVKAVGNLSGFAASLPQMFIEIVLMIISTFFIAADYDLLSGFVMRQFSGKAGKLMVSIKEYVAGTLLVCIRSYALIMSITFVEMSIGLTIIGIKNSILIAFLIAMFDILPVLGTGGIMIPWVIIAAIQGKVSLSLGLLIVYLVVTVVRNILEPKIVGSQIGLHPIVTLVSMFAGAQLFGVFGLFGFPILLSLLRHLNDTGTIKLFK